MTKEQWLNKVILHEDALRNIVALYFPVDSCTDSSDVTITAPNAEIACEAVREQIRKEYKGNPVVDFNNALANKDTDTIAELLAKAWFGIPESTCCWGIRGFSVMCDLLDDPIEQEE